MEEHETLLCCFYIASQAKISATKHISPFKADKKPAVWKDR